MASSQHNKLEVKDSEKNPKVQMNNWSLDVLLGKEMTRLGKSEKTVLNSRTMEQKILHKRYKKMMHQSKLTYARITSNHEMEKDLRSASTMRFNTNLGADDADDMLKKTWDYGRRKRACVIGQANITSPSSLFGDNITSSSSSKPARAKSAPAKTAAFRQKQKVARQQSQQNQQQHQNRPPVVKSPVGAPLSQDSGISLDGLELLDEDNEVIHQQRPVSVQRASVRRRPATAALTHAHRQLSAPAQTRSSQQQQQQPRNNAVERVASANGTCNMTQIDEKRPETTGTRRQRKGHAIAIPKVSVADGIPTVVSMKAQLVDENNKEEEGSRLHEASSKSILPGDDSKNSGAQLDYSDEQPSGQFLQTYLDETTQQPSASRRPSTTPASTTPQPHPNNFKQFVHTVIAKDPSGRPNLLDVQKVRVRVANYDTQVENFSNRVAPLKAPSSAITDYYTSRIMDGQQRSKRQPMVTCMNPSEKEMKREIGNIGLKSITFKPLNSNYA